MIVDSIKNCEKYYGVHSDFKKSFEFIKKAVAENLPVGKYEIDGDDVFAFIQEYTSKHENESAFEGHRNYIDIQYIVSGTEVMMVADISKMKESCDYKEDVVFFEDYEKASMCVIEAGEYGIFFPWDTHKPGLCFDGKPDSVKKIVVKVKV